MDGSVQTRQRWQDAPAAGVTAVVLGMHRSGTSCLVQILKACGMHFDDAGCQPLPNNMEGFGESQEALAINDMILRVPAALGTAYRKSCSSIPRSCSG